MNPRDDFAVWLKGYLDGNPDGADDRVKEQLNKVIAEIVADRLRNRAGIGRSILEETFGQLRPGGAIQGGPVGIGVHFPNHVGVAFSDRTTAVEPPETPKGVHWGIQEPDAHMKV